VSTGALHEPFLALLPAGGQVLDAGCGSGRDALEFRRRGYVVTAIDASPAMATQASAVLGQPVRILRFQDLDFDAAFDGVWACASLLHVPTTQLDGVFVRVLRALKPGGVWYMSFKQGSGERVEEGRLFNDQTEDSVLTLLARHGLEPVRLWGSQDVRTERSGQRWVNAIARKAASGT
jgi:SAM-dependent methyltransferase